MGIRVNSGQVARHLFISFVVQSSFLHPPPAPPISFRKFLNLIIIFFFGGGALIFFFWATLFIRQTDEAQHLICIKHKLNTTLIFMQITDLIISAHFPTMLSLAIKTSRSPIFKLSWMLSYDVESKRNVTIIITILTLLFLLFCVV